MNIRDIVEIRDKLKNDLAVVEKFLVIAKRQGLANDERVDFFATGNAQETLKPIIAESNGVTYGVIGKSVVEAIRMCPAEFTVTDVHEAVSRELNRPLGRTQISVALNRLKNQRKIEMVKPKLGRKPAIYRKT